MLRHRRARPMVALSSQSGPFSSPFSPEQQRRLDDPFEKAAAKYPPDRRRPARLGNSSRYGETATPEPGPALTAGRRSEPGQPMAPGPGSRHLEERHGIEKQSQPQATGTAGLAAATWVPTERS